MNTAEQNISLLPKECWGVLLEDNSLIKIKSGESGYRKCKQPEKYIIEQTLLSKSLKKDGCGIGRISSHQDMALAISDFADSLNEDEGITKAQRKAMEWGSMFGWAHGLSNPKRYDKDGKPIKVEQNV